MNWSEIVENGSSVPLWSQVADILRRRITSGTNVSDLSDVSLANEFKVSAGTARQAVNKLAGEGLLIRQRGRGTFVTTDPLRGSLNTLQSFMDEWKLQGHSVRVELLSRKTMAANIAIAAGLGMQPGESVAYNVRRRFADDQPVAIDYRYIPSKLDDGLTDEDFTQESLWRVLQFKKGIHPFHVRATVKAAGANEEAADLLDVPIGSPVLHHEIQIFERRGRCIMFGHSVYHPERFVYSITQEDQAQTRGRDVKD